MRTEQEIRRMFDHEQYNVNEFKRHILEGLAPDFDDRSFWDSYETHKLRLALLRWVLGEE